MKLWFCYEALKRSSVEFFTSQINYQHNRRKTSRAPTNYPAWKNFVAKLCMLQVAFTPGPHYALLSLRHKSKLPSCFLYI